ncbi:MAG: DUF932 domain-containing protein [Phycisphaerae bacterium]|nr:DUF932 domain-containing protein [Phycisphaerae bacterium]
MFASAAASAVPHVLSHIPDPGLTYEEVLDRVTKRADLALPDQVLPLSRLHATPEGTIEVPGLGRLGLTVWSRRQLASLLGIRWDRWFASELVAPADRAEEINRRFRASGETWKIRARRPATDEMPGDYSVLRAFVSPTYAPIDDLPVFETLGTVLAGQLDGIRFVRQDVTAESNQYAAVSLDEVDLGIAKSDRHRNGFLLANSEVGARSLTFLAWIWRLVCTNGLVAPVSRLLRLIHRSRKHGVLQARFAEAVKLLPESWQRTEVILRRARQDTESHPEVALQVLVESHPELRPIAETVHDAYEADPEPTRFGIVQALTRAAQGLPPERRLEVEELAGLVAAGPPVPPSREEESF